MSFRRSSGLGLKTKHGTTSSGSTSNLRDANGGGTRPWQARSPGRRLSRTTRREFGLLGISLSGASSAHKGVSVAQLPISVVEEFSSFFCRPSMTWQAGHVDDVRRTSSCFTVLTSGVRPAACSESQSCDKLCLQLPTRLCGGPVLQVRWGPHARAAIGVALFFFSFTLDLSCIDSLMFRGQKKKESISNCPVMFEFFTEGLITSITMVHHWIADQLPMLGCLLV